MRWLRYTADGRTGYGIVEGETVHETEGDIFTRWRRTGRRHALAAVRVEVPLIPRTFYCAGLNYTRHIMEGARRRGETPSFPPQAQIGYRAQNALVADGEDVVIPADAGPRVHYEGELVVVIGREARNLTPDNALGCVFGYTIGNDVSERDWQKNDRTFFRAKNSDTFKPMGPWIETEVDLAAMHTHVRLNGEVRTSFPTSDMLFSIETFLAETSRYCTLHPGDVMWMGTDGVSPDLVDGDLVEVEITGIGVLRNRFRKAA